MSTVRLRLVTAILITTIYPTQGLCDGITVAPDGTITIKQTVREERDEGAVTERDTASGQGTGVDASGQEAVQTKHQTTDPNATLPNRGNRTGGNASGGESTSDVTAKGGMALNPITLLGVLAIMAGVGCMIAAPHLKRLGMAVAGSGAAAVGVGFLVANPLAQAAVLGLGAAGALIWFARKYELLDETGQRLVRAVNIAEPTAKAEIKAVVNGLTTEKHDAVIDDLKRKAGI